MEKQVNNFMTKHQLLSAGSTVVVGISGGPDSLALLHFLWSLKEQKSLTIIAAHVDHMFRGKESKQDMEYVQNYCKQLNIKCEAKQIDVTSYQKERKLSSQVAARECRYTFFTHVMKKHKANLLALGHHGDDQVETMLMRMVRGSTMNGYAGMQPKRPYGDGFIIRPFLAVTKEEINRYCELYGLTPRIDPSNEKDSYTRNRFRHYVLPFLKQENATVHEKFQQFSENLHEDQAYLEELTTDVMNKVMRKKLKNEILIDRDCFLRIRKPLQRRGIQLILNYLYKEIPPTLSSAHVDTLVGFCKSEKPSGALDFPNGLRIIRSYNDCLFTFNEGNIEPYEFIVPIPGVVELPNGHQLICEIHNKVEDIKGNDVFLLDEAHDLKSLKVRTRKNGDKMRVKGMKGHKKVKDIFIDEKIPLHFRDHWPVVEDSQGTILWLPGLKKSAYELHTHKSRYVILYYK
ncbi:tRNA lysidine(34) synthetase TilS [Priestia aryabhattai]|uniref:tRNA lysidine(34) synthetase TilS n=1 Tax=Priestia aryabhattai TaxID=412384 RepID=UPI00203FAA6D|nr:tRNA lysidine(34) synthetase TilS [Priestia aryabhattai]MCM3774094.1 tRNA lysidine(34) synthetase TilS [Priestia aryabhattai]